MAKTISSKMSVSDMAIAISVTNLTKGIDITSFMAEQTEIKPYNTKMPDNRYNNLGSILSRQSYAQTIQYTDGKLHSLYQNTASNSNSLKELYSDMFNTEYKRLKKDVFKYHN